MNITLYEKPLHIELIGNKLFVNGNEHPKSVRKAKDLVGTLVDGKIERDFDAYYMYRDIYKAEGMRFDITVIPAGSLGSECPKTFGHYHPKSSDEFEYAEVYQVLHGKALFILQKKNSDGSVNVTMVDAEKGDVLLFPPGYGHVSINKGEEELILSNLVYTHFDSEYNYFKENQGAAYYYLKNGEIKQNDNYVVHENERISSKELNERYGFSCNDLLQEFYTSPHKFAFLEKPGILLK